VVVSFLVNESGGISSFKLFGEEGLHSSKIKETCEELIECSQRAIDCSRDDRLNFLLGKISNLNFLLKELICFLGNTNLKERIFLSKDIYNLCHHLNKSVECLNDVSFFSDHREDIEMASGCVQEELENIQRDADVVNAIYLETNKFFNSTFENHILMLASVNAILL
jgi:hypothetical protein